MNSQFGQMYGLSPMFTPSDGDATNYSNTPEIGTTPVSTIVLGPGERVYRSFDVAAFAALLISTSAVPEPGTFGMIAGVCCARD